MSQSVPDELEAVQSGHGLGEFGKGELLIDVALEVVQVVGGTFKVVVSPLKLLL